MFHREAAAIEYKHIYKRRGDFFFVEIHACFKYNHFFKRLFKKPEDEAMHMVFADNGAEIPKAYVDHVEQLIWDNLNLNHGNLETS